MEIRDVIHGLIKYSPIEEKIINTRVFQRLRKIRQLGLASYVYPGTHHTRFEHSIGVMGLAEKICRELNRKYKRKNGKILFIDESNKQKLENAQELLSEPDIQDIRLAGLLHDIGHPPFSHVSERVLKKYYNRESVDADIETIHEEVTVKIIQENSEIGEILDKETRDRIVKIIKGKNLQDFKKHIVSGKLDADKLDYLLRDSYYAGVKYGYFDISKFIESLRITQEGEQTFLAMDEDGVFNLEQFILAKYHMSQQVYYHRIRRITDKMTVMAIDLAIKEGIDKICNAYKFDGSPECLEAYLSLNDENILQIISRESNGKAQELSDRIIGRRLYKEYYRKRVHEIDNAIQRNNIQKSSKNEEKMKELLSKISEGLNVGETEVIINFVDISKPNYKEPGFDIGDNSILIEMDDGNTKELQEIDWSILSLTQPEKTELYFEVYIDEETVNPDKSKEKKKEISDKIEKIVLGKGDT